MTTQHMSPDEIAKVDEMQKGGSGADEILTRLQKMRSKLGQTGPSQSAVYRAMSGETYKRAYVEQRGRPSTLPANMVKVGFQTRLNLIRKAKSDYQVTWSDVHKETKKVLKTRGALTRSFHMPSEGWFTKIMRAKTELRARAGKRRITHEKDYKLRRFELAKRWVKYPKDTWLIIFFFYPLPFSR